MMVRQLRLNLSVICLLWWVKSTGQMLGGSLFMMPGIVNTPFALDRGYSASTYYSLQTGVLSFPVKVVVRFGFPNYTEEVTSSHTVDYAIKGSFVQPGLVFYSGDFQYDDEVYYMAALAYIGQYTHNLAITVDDPNWGSHTFSYETETRLSGGIFECGMFFKLYKNLKANASLSLGFIDRPDNPFSNIQGFTNPSGFVPGAGHGKGPSFAMHIGMHYVID